MSLLRGLSARFVGRGQLVAMWAAALLLFLLIVCVVAVVVWRLRLVQ